MRSLIPSVIIMLVLIGCSRPTPVPTRTPDPTATVFQGELERCGGPRCDPLTLPPPIISSFIMREPTPFSEDALAALVPEGARARLGLGKIRGLISSPDGSRIAVATTIGIHVFEVPGLNHLWSLPTNMIVTYERWKAHLEWSSDGKFIVAGLDAEGFIVINADTGKEQWHYDQYAYIASDYVNYAMTKFSHDGQYLASSGCPARAELDSYCGYRAIYVWEAATGNQIAAAEFEDYDFEWSPDGKHVIWETEVNTGTARGNALDVGTGETVIIEPLPAREDWPIEWVYAESPDGTQVAMNNDFLVPNRGFTIWDTETHTMRQNFEIPAESDFDFMTWPQSDLMVVAEAGWYDEDWYILSIDLNAPLVAVAAIANSIATHSVDWSADGRYVVTGGYESFRVLDSSTGQMLKSCGNEGANDYYSTERYRSMVWLPDNPSLVAGIYYAYADDDGGHEVGIWDVTTCELQDNSLSMPANVEVEDIEWSPDLQVAAAAIGGHLIVWRTDTGTQIITAEDNISAAGISGVNWDEQGETHLAWSPDGTLIAVAEEIRGGITLSAIRVETRELVYQTRSERGRYLETNPHVEWSSDSQRIALYESDVRRNELAMLYTDAFLSVHNVASGTLEADINLSDESPYELSRMLTMVWSPDGRWIITGHNGAVEFVDRKPVYPGSDAAIYLWDAVTGKLVRTLRGHTGSTLDFDWSPDGQTLASVSDDGTIILWDLP